jgi:predicted amidohydrolase
MQIALAQTRPRRGNVAHNLVAHRQYIERAAARGAGAIFFAELSLTGYEPLLAADLAFDLADTRLADVQRASDAHAILVAAGAPAKTGAKPHIALLLFQPQRPRRLYAKQFLHGDEEPYFTAGPRAPGVLDTEPKIGLAICYELGVPAHAAATMAGGAEIYIASVAKTAQGVATATERLAGIARDYAVPVLMVNCVGPSGDGLCAGSSAAWDRRGRRLAQLAADGEGILLFDTTSESATLDAS